MEGVFLVCQMTGEMTCNVVGHTGVSELKAPGVCVCGVGPRYGGEMWPRLAQ